MTRIFRNVRKSFRLHIHINISIYSRFNMRKHQFFLVSSPGKRAEAGWTNNLKRETYLGNIVDTQLVPSNQRNEENQPNKTHDTRTLNYWMKGPLWRVFGVRTPSLELLLNLSNVCVYFCQLFIFNERRYWWHFCTTLIDHVTIAGLCVCVFFLLLVLFFLNLNANCWM